MQILSPESLPHIVRCGIRPEKIRASLRRYYPVQVIRVLPLLARQFSAVAPLASIWAALCAAVSITTKPYRHCLPQVKSNRLIFIKHLFRTHLYSAA